MKESPPRSAQGDRQRFWRNLVRVMTVQAVSLLLLWLLQRHYLA